MHVERWRKRYEYNLFEIQRTRIAAAGKLPAGKALIEIESRLATPGRGVPMDVVLKVDGKEIGRGRVPATAPLTFTSNDCLDSGADLGSPVSPDYFDRMPYAFNGAIRTTTVEYLK